MAERPSEHIHTRSHNIALPMPPTPVALQEQASADRCPTPSFHHILKVSFPPSLPPLCEATGSWSSQHEGPPYMRALPSTAL